MRSMMRNSTGLLCSIAFAVLGACAWGDGSAGPTPPGDDEPGSQEVCGDDICAATEVGVCTADCGSNPNNPGSGSGSNPTVSCGNFTCEANLGETTSTCPADCGSGSGSGSSTLDCNDQNTQIACIACIAGLGCTGVNATDCQTCLGGGGGLGSCEGGMPDGTCNAAAGEDATTCPFDCM